MNYECDGCINICFNKINVWYVCVYYIDTDKKTAPNDTLLLLELEVSEWGSRVGSGRVDWFGVKSNWIDSIDQDCTNIELKWIIVIIIITSKNLFSLSLSLSLHLF